MKLAVVNTGGRDPDQQFPDFAGEPDDRRHPPVNYHGYAACTGGSFHRRIDSISAEQKWVLLLLRRNLRENLETLSSLQEAGKTVAVSFKESGLSQISETLAKRGNIELLAKVCALADGCVASTPDSVAIYRAAGAKSAEFIPTPYPVDDPTWDFAVPQQDRLGVFIGTREFDVSSRHHLPALLAARSLGGRVTVINPDGGRGRKLLRGLQIPELEIIEGTLPYSKYLRLISKHRIVFQLDCSAVPGQVAGDSLLCRVPCVGGDGAVERLAFRESCGHGRELPELVEIARRHLSDNAFYQEACARFQDASAKLSYGRVAAQLSGFFHAIA